MWEEYFDAIRAGDLRAALTIIDGHIASGIDLTTVYLDVLQPAMREVGRCWQENEMTVADEHLSTAITQSVMAYLFGRGIHAADRRGPVIIAACADTERHEIGLRMLCDILEMEGWEAMYLGATVPVESLVEMVDQKRPDVLALSATIAPHLPKVRGTIQAVRGRLKDAAPFIIVGGRPFLDNPDLSVRVGADLTASDGREAARVLNNRFESRKQTG